MIFIPGKDGMALLETAAGWHLRDNTILSSRLQVMTVKNTVTRLFSIKIKTKRQAVAEAQGAQLRIRKIQPADYIPDGCTYSGDQGVSDIIRKQDESA